MSRSQDRLYELLPGVHRLRDAQQGYPLRAVLRVINEQVNLVEDDIAQLYDNWFIETCQDWVVPYIGDLIGHRPVHEAGEAGDVASPQERARNRTLVPRREVANLLSSRRRKGTLALLELLARDVAGWPAPCSTGRSTPSSCASAGDARPICATATRWISWTGRSSVWRIRWT